MGGHIVQGHVDTTARIVSITPDGNAMTFRFCPRDPGVLRYVVEKGFVAVDGASLTVTAVCDGEGLEGNNGQGGDGWWEVMLIAYTQENIVTARKSVGDEVNVEVDMVGKLVEKNVKAWFSGGGERGSGNVALERMVKRMVDERLKELRASS